ncbi:virion structural protein [Xanthomonas phage XaC1]|nr:virion structural protein [Xanthomonas phage XaC1]
MIWYTGKVLNRIVVFIMCSVFTVFMYLNSVNIKLATNNMLAPYAVDEPYTVPKRNVSEINTQLDKIIDSTPAVSTILLYKFVANTQTSIYNGRIGITSKSRDGSDFITRFRAYWLPMNSNPEKLQTLLLNNTHYETVDSIKKNCSMKETECQQFLYVKENFKAIMSFPIYDDSDYSVKGYMTFLLDRELSEDEQVLLIKSMSPYLNKIANLVNQK